MREFGRVGSFLRVSAAPCAERVKSDRVHVSTYFDVDTIFRLWLSVLHVGGLDAYFASRAAPLAFACFWPVATSPLSGFLYLPRERARGHFPY